MRARMEPEFRESPGVYAEYDPATLDLRAFGSSLNLAETLQEKRLHNDGIFHLVVDLDVCLRLGNVGWRDADWHFDDILEFHYYIGFFEEIFPSKRTLATVRAVEGVVAKTNVGCLDENFDLFRETFTSHGQN